jgi:hypothetical protein
MTDNKKISLVIKRSKVKNKIIKVFNKILSFFDLEEVADDKCSENTENLVKNQKIFEILLFIFSSIFYSFGNFRIKPSLVKYFNLSFK